MANRHALTELFRKLRMRGWEARGLTSKYMLVHKTGARVWCSRTPSDLNFIHNIERDCDRALRRHHAPKRIS
jgi:hypothetical protein